MGSNPSVATIIKSKLVDELVDDMICIIMQPYVYKITSKNGEYYYGVRWDYTGKMENDLWKDYFTSSDTVHDLIEKNGVDYFIPEILFVFEDPQPALTKETELIRCSIGDDKCLNRACGKCTIWNEQLKKQVGNTLREFYRNNPEKKESIRLNKTGEKNQNYNLPPWKNVNGNKESWLKAGKIYDDFITEKWKLGTYRFGFRMLCTKYGICQGSARKLLKLLVNGWNPYEDREYLEFCGPMVKLLDTSALRADVRKDVPVGIRMGLPISAQNRRTRTLFSIRKIAIIPKEELEVLVKTKTLVAIGKIYGVSRITIRNRCNEYEIQRPSLAPYTQFRNKKL